jgi:hypothetical protein
VTNNEDLKAKIFDMEESLQDERQFKEFYSFVFPFAKTKTQKSMDVEVSWTTESDFKHNKGERDFDVSWMLQVALALWEIVLKDRYAHVPLFIDFIRVSV